MKVQEVISEIKKNTPKSIHLTKISLRVNHSILNEKENLECVIFYKYKKNKDSNFTSYSYENSVDELIHNIKEAYYEIRKKYEQTVIEL